MTEEQIEMLRHLIKQEIDAAQIDGMEHGAWGWADKQLEEGWKTFIDSFNEWAHPESAIAKKYNLGDK